MVSKILNLTWQYVKEPIEKDGFMVSQSLCEEAGLWVESYRHISHPGLSYYMINLYDGTFLHKAKSILEFTAFIGGWIAHKNHIEGV